MNLYQTYKLKQMNCFRMLVKKAKSIQTRKTLLVVERTNVKDEEPLKMTVLPFWVW
jgi:hypothetical protein